MRETYYIGKYVVSDGSKPVDNVLTKPIEWIALEENAGKTLLISRDVLDWELYDDDVVTWGNSYLKRYLNDLYESYFTSEEKSAICDTPHGKLFLLSEEELNKYFPTENDKRAIMNIYEVDKEGNRSIFIEHHTYWVRTDEIDELEDDLPAMSELGDIEYYSPDADEIGVRPAMLVDTKAARILSAQMGFNKWHHFWELDKF